MGRTRSTRVTREGAAANASELVRPDCEVAEDLGDVSTAVEVESGRVPAIEVIDDPNASGVATSDEEYWSYVEDGMIGGEADDLIELEDDSDDSNEEVADDDADKDGPRSIYLCHKGAGGDGIEISRAYAHALSPD